MKKVFFRLLMIAVVALSVTFVACKDDEQQTPEVTLSETVCSIHKGDTIYLTVEPNIAVRWQSSNDDVATINNGMVVGVDWGKATINVATADRKVAYCIVNVVQPVESITLNKDIDTLILGATLALSATIMPENASYTDVVWSSSDSAVATVNGEGLVTAVGVGTASIFATNVDSNKMDTCLITVRLQPVSGVKLSQTVAATLLVGTKVTLVDTVLPKDATNQNVTWESSNEAVATVNNVGVVTAVAGAAHNSTAVITVTTEDGSKTATCNVTVVTAYPNLRVGATTWAATNVDDSATFAARPDMYNKFYQRRNGNKQGMGKPYVATGNVSGWNVSPVGTNTNAPGTDPNGGWDTIFFKPCPSGWNLPTISQFNALRQVMVGTAPELQSTWVEANVRGNAVAGRFVGPNHKTCSMSNITNCIFMPAVGYREATKGTLTNQGIEGIYWTGEGWTPNSNSQVVTDFNKDSHTMETLSRYSGFNVRCVQ